MQDKESHHKNIIKSSGIISAATFLSRILGFVRDMIIASFFGAGFVADSFFIAFRIPNILRKLMSEGTLSAGLVPEFTGLMEDGKDEEVNKAASLLLNLGCVALTCFVVIGMVWTRGLLWIIAPGFNGQRVELTVNLMRWMLPYIPLLGITVVLIGFLHARRRFLVPALTPIILNICIILSALILTRSLSVTSLAIGVLAGGLAQMLLQIYTAVKKGFRYRFCVDYRKSPVVKKVMSSFLAAIWGLSVVEVNIIVSMQLASFLPNGSISFLYYSNRIVQFPLGIFGVAVGTAVLPTLCLQAKRGESIAETFKLAVEFVLFLVVPSTVGIIVLRAPIVSILFERGAFSASNVFFTSQALLGYSLGLCFLALLKVIVPVFYSLGDYRTPVRAASFAILANLVIGVTLLPLRHTGLALASSIAGGINLSILVLALKKRLGHIDWRIIGVELLKNLAASAIMGAVLLSWGAVESSGALFLHIGGGVLLYFFVSLCLKSSAMGFAVKMVRKN